jgi:hypothetical protein
MLALSAVPSHGLLPSATARTQPQHARAPQPAMETVADLEQLANKLNPAVGYWDPLKLGEATFWDNTNEETIGWLRHAEIKHGRVAMAGFVGYVLQSNGVKFPWAPFDAITATSPPAQWDELAEVAKWQIILGVGFLEWWSELRLDNTPHYMKGGKPGYFPPFSATPDQLPHPLPLNLFDPFGLTKKLSEEKKQSLLVTEINNGRLAQIGIIAFLSEQKVPGSVPLLKGLVEPYGGETMAPFAADFHLF